MADLSDVDRAALAAGAEELIKLKETKGWQILMHVLERDRLEALEMLAKVEPTDIEKIRALQNQVHRFYWFATTIEDVIQEGLDVEPEEPELEDAAEMPPGTAEE